MLDRALVLRSSTLVWLLTVGVWISTQAQAKEVLPRWSAEEITCPEGTELRRVEAPDGFRSALWCEATRGTRVARHGPYLELYADGSTARQGLYLKGVQAGLWVSWTPSGTIESQRMLLPGEASRYILQPEDLCPPGSRRERSFGFDHRPRMWSQCHKTDKHGEQVLVGPYVTWDAEVDANGAKRYLLREIMTYENDRRHGLHRVFEGPFGREVLVEEETFVEGRPDGESRAYYLDGSLREVRTYRGGELDGEWIGFFSDGSERWRILYESGYRSVVEGDFTVAGQECPDQAVPTTSADGREEFCATRQLHFLYRDGAFVLRDAAGDVIESGLYQDGKKVELWHAPPGVELPPKVSDEVQVAAIQLMIGDRPYVELNSPQPEDKTAAATDVELIDSALEGDICCIATITEEEMQQIVAGTAESGALPVDSEPTSEPVTDSTGTHGPPDGTVEGVLDSGSDQSLEPSGPAFDIWFINNHTRKYPHPRTEVENGVVKVYGLSPGSYYMKVEVDAEPLNGRQRTGDLASSSGFEVVLGEVTQATAPLLYTLRLTEPWDSNEDFPETNLDCAAVEPLPGQFTFAWQPPAKEDPKGIEYGYKITRRHCDPPADLEVMVESQTFDTSVDLELPPTRLGEFYEWTLYAKRGEHAIGQMMTFYEGGAYGWSLQFRVE